MLLVKLDHLTAWNKFLFDDVLLLDESKDVATFTVGMPKLM